MVRKDSLFLRIIAALCSFLTATAGQYAAVKTNRKVIIVTVFDYLTEEIIRSAQTVRLGKFAEKTPVCVLGRDMFPAENLRQSPVGAGQFGMNKL
jgi:hypothetical protein